MMTRLVLVFIFIPLIELALLIKVGQWMGVLNTILLVVFTGLLGAVLARSQGLRVVRQIQPDLMSGNIPNDSLLDGLFVLIGGILLLTPGLITDSVGFLLMIPAFRSFFRNRLKNFFMNKFMGNGRGGFFTIRH